MGEASYRVVPPPRLKRDYVGRTVRTRRALENSFVAIPAGTLAVVDDRTTTGAKLKITRCRCCGMSPMISRVRDHDIEFVEIMEGGAHG